MIPTKQILKKTTTVNVEMTEEGAIPQKNFLKLIAGDEKKLEDGKRTRLKLHR